MLWLSAISYQLADARAFKSPDHAVKQMDAVLAFLGYYGHQDMIRLESDVPSIQVFAWAREVGEIIERENRKTPRP